MMGTSVIQLIVLAAVALFLIFKLRRTLGTRDGFEGGTNAPNIEPSPEPRRDFEVIEGGTDREIAKFAKNNDAAAEALYAMKQTEARFSIAEFMEGARKAYEWILIEFAEGRLDAISPYLSDDVKESFEETVAARPDDNRAYTAKFVGIREATLKAAEFDHDTSDAEITVEFVCDLTSYVTDSEGQLIEGDADAVRTQKDVWSFSRKMGSGNPNWILVATGV